MAPVNSPRTTLYADREHAGLRFAVMAIIVITFVIAFLTLNALISSQEGTLFADYALALSCAGGLVIALATAALGESIMKRSWPSGRGVTFDERELEASLPGGETAIMYWSRRIWTLKWYFSLKGYPRGGRERRVPARYYCLACQLQQDEARFIVYSFLTEQQAKGWIDENHFHEIKPGDFYERNPLRKWVATTDRPQLPASILTGKDGPYWMAEKRRWEEGLELSVDDFISFMQVVESREEA